MAFPIRGVRGALPEVTGVRIWARADSPGLPLSDRSHRESNAALQNEVLESDLTFFNGIADSCRNFI